MANMPHPDLRQLNHRVPGDLVAAVKAAAKRNGEAEKAFVIRALQREIERTTTKP